MDYLPLYHKLDQRQCLIVGGGEIALRKARLIASAGAKIHVVAPEISEALKALLAESNGAFSERSYQPSDLEGCVLVVCATDNHELHVQISEACQARSLPVNVVDTPALSTVIVPAIVDRSPIIATVSTGGASPVLTRKLRQLLESLIPESIQQLAKYFAGRRQALKEKFPDVEERRRHVENFLDSAGSSAAMAGDNELADKHLYQPSAETMTGEVYIVGAGPGDPDLLTLKALQLMQQADIILHDNLVPDEILNRARRDATREYVGKQGGAESTAQESINEKLVRLALEGHRVLRLKGGDPSIFGRVGEEMKSLIEAKVPFQVVPGITAATGCAAYAGIPLTHRDFSQSVRFVTGHPKDGKVKLEWQEFAHANQTIVFYMGLGGLAAICDQLIGHGRDANTPIAIIAKGTTPEQKVVVGTLGNIVEEVTKHEIARPTLIIVGEVVSLYQG